MAHGAGLGDVRVLGSREDQGEEHADRELHR
jgi:hypothetical protein